MSRYQPVFLSHYPLQLVDVFQDPKLFDFPPKVLIFFNIFCSLSWTGTSPGIAKSKTNTFVSSLSTATISSLSASIVRSRSKLISCNNLICLFFMIGQKYDRSYFCYFPFLCNFSHSFQCIIMAQFILPLGRFLKSTNY